MALSHSIRLGERASGGPVSYTGIKIIIPRSDYVKTEVTGLQNGFTMAKSNRASWFELQ
jgi:hypothetical protein